MRLLLGLLLLLPAAPGARAAEKGLDQYAVERWRVSDGLPGESIQALAQAADGQLWIATLGGLARWDGLRFTRVPAPDGGRGVHDVRRLLAGRDGSMWAGSPYLPPLRFGPAGPALPSPGWPAGTGTLAWDQDQAGHLWLLGGERLLRFEGDRYSPQPIPGLGGREVNELVVRAGGTVWLGTDQGLFRATPDGLVAEGVPGPVTAMHEDRRGRLWIAGGGQLHRLDGQQRQAWGPEAGVPRAIASLADDAEGSLWLGSSQGLGRRRPDGDRFELFTAAHGLPENDVTAVLVDREGSLWVGTRNGGLAQFSARTLGTRDQPPSIESGELSTLCEDHQGAWWFGTPGKGAVRWQGGRATTLTRADGLPSDHVHAVLPGDPGEVWIGTSAGLRVWRAGKLIDPGVWSGPAAALYRDRRGVLWIGGHGGVGRLERGRLTTLGPAEGLLASRQVRAIGEDADGHVWVGGIGGPVVRWDGARFVPSPLLRGSKASPVRSMLTDRTGVFWLSIDRSGLWRVDRDGVQVFDARHGLEAEVVYQLLEDDAGDLWLGTNESVLRVSRASLDAVAEGRRPTLEVVSFETTDRRAGVVALAIRQPSAWKARDGRLRFATQRGSVEIDPRQVHANPVRPPVVIESVLADGRPLATAGQAQLPPRPGRLEIRYAARALLEPTKVRYRYRLEGVDPAWIEAGAGRVAAYAGLPAGTFRFQVQASNNDRLWNETGASLSLVIAPPFYRRAWFYLLGALALLPVGLGLYRVRVARLRAHYLGMFTERTRVARELHDTLLQGLSGVAMQLRATRARLGSDAEGTRRELEQLQDTVSRCLEDARRAVWDLRDRGPRDSALGPAIARFARRLFRQERTAHQIQIEGPPRQLPNAVEDELFKIAQESLRNVAAHARATLVRIRLCYLVGQVSLTIEDDGVGFAPAGRDPEATGHFGLAGLRERAARIGGRLEVRSAPGQGTTVEVVAPAPGGAPEAPR